MTRRDYRSPEAEQYRKLYKTPEWLRLRADQLKRQPLCERCLARRPSRYVPATVVNHRIPHKGDLALFRDPANHESTCKPCHDGPIQNEERAGYSTEVGSDGLPTDPRHPFNA